MADEILGHIDLLMSQRPQCKEVLGPYRELVGLMRGMQFKPFPSDLRSELTDVKMKEGFPLFAPEELPLDFETSARAMERLLDHLSTAERKDRAGLKKALQHSESDPGWPVALLKAVTQQDNESLSEIAEDVGLDPKVLQFLGQVALKPAMRALRDALSQKMDKEEWNRGYCPLCGSPPNMAYFAKSGRRHLHCELCGEEWPYPRLSCPFCQNEDHKLLGYFEAEQEEGFRVDYCRKCKRYIKTLDKRAFENAAPMGLEYLATLHLDLLANEHGFK